MAEKYWISVCRLPPRSKDSTTPLGSPAIKIERLLIFALPHSGVASGQGSGSCRPVGERAASRPRGITRSPDSKGALTVDLSLSNLVLNFGRPFRSTLGLREGESIGCGRPRV